MKHRQISTKTFPVSYNDIFPVLVWIAVFFMTWTFMHGADHFLKMTPEALGKYFELRWVLIAHITFGGAALITGIVQFWPKLRNYSPRLHRFTGYLYLLAILISSVCALILASTTAYRISWANAFTLQIWSAVWISSTAIALHAATRKKFNMHREWMTRSYIVTIAFLVSGFLFRLPYIQQLGTSAEVSVPLFWMGWAVPLYGYEIIRSYKINLRPSSRR